MSLNPQLKILPCIYLLDSIPINDDLKSELPMYLTAAEDVSCEIDPITWWKLHKADLHKWSKAFTGFSPVKLIRVVLEYHIKGF